MSEQFEKHRPKASIIPAHGSGMVAVYPAEAAEAYFDRLEALIGHQNVTLWEWESRQTTECGEGKDFESFIAELRASKPDAAALSSRAGEEMPKLDVTEDEQRKAIELMSCYSTDRHTIRALAEEKFCRERQLRESYALVSSLRSQLEAKDAEIAGLSGQVAQKDVQIAACGVAAEGWGLSMDNGPAVQGDDGWTPAYESILKLRYKSWRCFHCDFFTLDEAQASAHFGDRDDAEEFKPLCKWWQRMEDGERAEVLQDTIQQLNSEQEENGDLRDKIGAALEAADERERALSTAERDAIKKALEAVKGARSLSHSEIMAAEEEGESWGDDRDTGRALGIVAAESAILALLQKESVS